jgi:hypothetical protein
MAAWSWAIIAGIQQSSYFRVFSLGIAEFLP